MSRNNMFQRDLTAHPLWNAILISPFGSVIFPNEYRPKTEYAYPFGFLLEHGGILKQAAVQVLAQFVTADHTYIGICIEVVEALPEPPGILQQRVYQKVTPPVVPHVQSVDAFSVTAALGMELEHIVVGRQVGLLYHLDERPHVVADVPDLDEPCIGLEMPQAAQRRGIRDIGHDKDVHDTTYENSQARERTQILMDVANQTGGIVVGTGDLSELALGWATYNGDHMSMYGVNAGIPKTLVKYIVKWAAENHFDGTDGSVADVENTEAAPSGTGSADIASAPRSTGEILADIIDTPISPELLPADGQGRISQKTEDLVGPYELHDFFLYHFFRSGYAPEKILFLAEKAFEGKYDSDTIRKWLKTFVRRFFSQQFKRSCLPDGPKVGSVSLSPRGDWRMPSDARPDLFLSGLES